jgi:hypothetical protein
VIKKNKLIELIIDELEDVMNEDDVIDVVTEEYEDEFGKPKGVYFETHPGSKFREVLRNILKNKLSPGFQFWTRRKQ